MNGESPALKIRTRVLCLRVKIFRKEKYSRQSVLIVNGKVAQLIKHLA
jgi:hypothetical protein